jgi:hypothetical protein
MKPFDQQLDDAGLSIEPETRIQLDNIDNVWPELAGSKLAEWTEPIAIDRHNGKLIVGVADKIWLEEIEKQHDRIEDRMTVWLPAEIQSVEFELDRSIRSIEPDEPTEESTGQQREDIRESLPEHLEESVSKLDDKTASIVRRIHGKITD